MEEADSTHPVRRICLAVVVVVAFGCTRKDVDGGSAAPTNGAPSTAGAGSSGTDDFGGPTAGGDPCAKTTSLGDPICCGQDGEIPNVSCIDLSGGGTIYGSYGQCIGQGEIYDARFAGGVCCEGLAMLHIAVPSEGETSPPNGVPAGCRLESLSGVLCSACGNESCDDGENWCNCPDDCARPDAGTQ